LDAVRQRFEEYFDSGLFVNDAGASNLKSFDLLDANGSGDS